MKRDKTDTNIEYMAGPVTSINYDELESTPVLVHRREKRAAARRARSSETKRAERAISWNLKLSYASFHTLSYIHLETPKWGPGLVALRL